MSQERKIKKLKAKVAVGRQGWFGIRHKEEGWWIGGKEGPHTYEDMELAKAAMTIAREMLRPKILPLEIARFDGADRRLDDIVAKINGEEAIKRIENRTVAK